MWYVYTMEYYAAVKNDSVMPFAATEMDPEMSVVSKVSHTEKDGYPMKSLIYGN